MPDCIFCSIVAGDSDAEIVYDSSEGVAFLDHRPLFWGHVLFVPRSHHATLPDLPDDEIGPYFATVRILSVAVPEAMEAAGSFVAINNTVSQSVPHLHTHVVPRNRKDGLRGFFWPRTRYEDRAHMERIGQLVRVAIARRGGT